jgi:hypothetical protein
MSFLGKFKGLDLHPKFREEFMEKTRSGGVGTCRCWRENPRPLRLATRGSVDAWFSSALVCGWLAVTVFTVIVVLYLTVANIVSYISPVRTLREALWLPARVLVWLVCPCCVDSQPVTQHMTVDSARDVPIRINFDVTFPSYVTRMV